MNFPLAIDLHRTVLLRVLAVLVAAVGGSLSVETLPRHVRLATLRLLRPAESATRRLIMVVAREMVAPVRRALPSAGIRLQGRRKAAPRAGFRLLDPVRKFDPAPPRRVPGPGPRISVPGWMDPVFEPTPPQPSPDDPVDATRLCRRMQALQAALEDLPKQARRLARIKARHKGRIPNFRRGRPPGFRTRPTHEIDETLTECHHLALLAMKPPDSS